MWWMGAFYAVYLVFLLVEVWSMFTDHPRVHRYACLASSCTPSSRRRRSGSLRRGVLADVLVRHVHTDHDARHGAPRRLRAARDRLQHSSSASSWRASSAPSGSPSRPSGILLAVGLVGSLVFAGRAVFDGLTSDDGAFHAATPPWSADRWPSRSGVASPSASPCRCCSSRCLAPARSSAPGSPAWPSRCLRRSVALRDRWADHPDDGRRRGRVGRVCRVRAEPCRDQHRHRALAFVAFVYTLAERYLDLREADIHFGFHVPDVPGALRRQLAARHAAKAASEVSEEPVGGGA